MLCYGRWLRPGLTSRCGSRRRGNGEDYDTGGCAGFLFTKHRELHRVPFVFGLRLLVHAQGPEFVCFAADPSRLAFLEEIDGSVKQ